MTPHRRQAPTIVVRKRLVVIAALLAALVRDFETTIVVTAMPSVANDLGDLQLYPWVFVVYLFASTASIPLFGKLADTRGRKPVMLLGIGLFLAGSIGCGLAWSMYSLIGARVLQGLGSGIMFLVGATLIGDLFDARTQARLEGLFTASPAIAGALGPVVGSLIVRLGDWRWMFWGIVPLVVICGVLIGYGIRDPIQRRRSSLDVWGAVLVSGSIAAILAAAHSSEPIAYAACAVALGAAFILVEQRVRDPLLPLHLFRDPIIAISSVLLVLIGGALLPIVSYLPLYVQQGLGRPASDAGFAIMPIAFGWMLACIVIALLLPRFGFRAFVRSGLVIAFIGAASLVFALQADAHMRSLQASAFLIGVGLGLAEVAIWIAMQTTVAYAVRGITTAISLVLFSLGGTLGVGVLGVLIGGGAETSAEHAEALRSGFPIIALIVVAALFVATTIGLLFPDKRCADSSGHVEVEAPSRAIEKPVVIT
ncbi:MAG: MFS transporter [Kofleriaceae bacterium]